MGRGRQNIRRVNNAIATSRDSHLVVILYQSKNDNVTERYNIDYVGFGTYFYTDFKSPLCEEEDDTIRAILKERKYDNKIHLVYDMKKERLCYLDFSKVEVILPGFLKLTCE